jgi:hypothetical protein
MTPAEQQRFRGYFPNLNVQNVVVTDEADPVYNCIAWTVGVTNAWIWPGNALGDFDRFYLGFGYVRAGNGPLAAWGLSPANMRHGSISGPGHGPRWESKCGGDLRIQHGLAELVGSMYGRVVAFYHKPRTGEGPLARALKAAMKEKTSRSYLSAAQRKALREAVQAIPADLRTVFAQAFEAWKQTWFQGGLAINSDPYARAVGKEYDALIALGPGIVPLVVEQLADPENFLALQLYDAIQGDAGLVIHFEPDDERILEGEQGRARRVVQAWFANR